MRAFSFADDVPGLHGSSAQHDFLVRPWNVSDVRRPHVRVPHLPQIRREAHPIVLKDELDRDWPIEQLVISNLYRCIRCTSPRRLVNENVAAAFLKYLIWLVHFFPL